MFDRLMYMTKSQVSKELCPYCFEYFHIKDTPYRCISPQSVCEWEKDDVYEKFWGDSRKRGRVLVPEGKFSERFQNQKRCDKCENITHKRLCPHCRKELPAPTGEYKNHIYAVIGGANAGKSHYISILINQIRNELGPKMNLLLDALDDDTRDRYKDEFYKPIFEKHTVIQKTQSGTTNKAVRMPLIYSVSFTKDTLFEKNKIVKYLTLVFFDTAGEDLNSEDTMAIVNKYIYRSDGIIMLIDPLQIHQVRDKLAGKIAMPEGISAESIDILSRTTHLIEKGRGLKPTEKIKIPLAVTFTKMDAVDELLDESMQLKHQSQHQNGFDTDDAVAVSSEMKSLLITWGEQAIVHMAETRFKDYEFFGLTALGCNPHKDSKIPKVAPRRVEDPFLWLLSKSGILKNSRR